MFSRLTMLRPSLKYVHGRSSKVIFCDIRKFSDAAIDRELQQSYIGLYPRLLTLKVISCLIMIAVASLPFWKEVTALQLFSNVYLYFRFHIPQDMLDPTIREAVKKMIEDNVLPSNDFLQLLSLYAGLCYLPCIMYLVPPQRRSFYPIISNRKSSFHN